MVRVSSGPDTVAASLPSISIERLADASSSAATPAPAKTWPACTPLLAMSSAAEGPCSRYGKWCSSMTANTASIDASTAAASGSSGSSRAEVDRQLALESQLQETVTCKHHAGGPALALEQPAEDGAVDRQLPLGGRRCATHLVADDNLAPVLTQPGDLGLDGVPLLRIRHGRGGVWRAPVEVLQPARRRARRCPSGVHHRRRTPVRQRPPQPFHRAEPG